MIIYDPSAAIIAGIDFEQIADDAVVGDFEDRRVGILVDRDDRPRALHADDVLDRAGDAEREVELRARRSGRSCRSGAPSAASRRRRSAATPRVRRRAPSASCCATAMMLGALDAATDRDDALGLREIDGLLRFAEGRFGLLTNRRRGRRSPPPSRTGAGARPSSRRRARNAPI